MSNDLHPRFSMSYEPSAEPPPAHVDPADANGCSEWLAGMGKINLTVAFIQAPYSPALWANSGFENSLGTELTEAGLGHLDSAQWGNPITFFFYLHSGSLAAGLLLIRGSPNSCESLSARLRERFGRDQNG